MKKNPARYGNTSPEDQIKPNAVEVAQREL